ncbi:MAG: crotonase/enoyl-CoA hydratase family protein [Halioglobus sp.]|nr:crotonase/enoyl-CoA hydratase family protein [Halioglobus sp.]
MNYELRNEVAIVSIDDGKANVVGHTFIDELNEALNRAEQDAAGAVILRGREGIFSAGFDLGEFKKGAEAGMSMVSKGMQLLIRLYSFPLPLVVACTGHGIAMGAFIILACDKRIGVRGKFKITLPETAIGMELPAVMMELTASRISPQYITRVVIQSEVFDPDQALEIGFLDEVVEVGALDDKAMAIATQLTQLPGVQYAANKLLARKKTLLAMTEEFGKTTMQGS